MHQLIQPPKARPGDRVAILSPSFAAPAFAPEVHEQAMRRFKELTGLIPVEYPTTRKRGASPAERARDFNSALANPDIRAIVSTIGGDDQIRLIRYLDATLLSADPKPFLGYSDNTNILNWFWTHGVAAFYGGSTQVHFGPGPHVDQEHLATIRAALLDGGSREVTNPKESEDHGLDWKDPRALTEFGEREPTEPWRWAGPKKRVAGPTWGGCIEVLDWISLAGRLPENEHLQGGVLLLETSEELPPVETVRRWVRALGERGMFESVAGVVLARPPVTEMGEPVLPANERASRRSDQYDAVIEEIAACNPEAVVCAGVPFGHTRPQVIVPYGGSVILDGSAQKIYADYS